MSLVKDKIIFALDFSSYKEAKYFIDLLHPEINFYKVGLQLFLATGEKIIDYLKYKGAKIFLDLKLYDIPNTVKRAIKVISKMDIDYTTVHSDRDVMLAAMEGKEDSNLKILAVSILTSKTIEDEERFTELIKEKFLLIKECNVDGIILSGLELKLANEIVPSLIKVVPGIRKEIKNYDQKRVVSPRYAIENGANHIVIGREIYESKDPLKKAKEIIEEIKEL
jgi:orotidine-5'-phosphate decarboxylase